MVTTACGDNGREVDGSGSYDPQTGQGGFRCLFPDGPAATDVRATATDSGGARDADDQKVTVGVANVAPEVALSGDATADEGQTSTYTYTVTDLGEDPAPTIVESCGVNAAYVDTQERNSFECRFPDGPETTMVSTSVDDGDPSNSAGTDEIEVAISNLAPVAADDSFTTDEDTQLEIQAADGLLKNDTDAGDDGLSAVLASGPDHGRLTLNGDGSLSYQPEGDYNGPDSFTYRADDGDVEGNTATVRISVEAVNDAPRITGEQPTSNAATADLTPRISAIVKDPETRLARGDIKFYLDGRLLRRFSYNPATGMLNRGKWHALDQNKHRVKVVAVDAEGLVTTKAWDFVVKKR